MSPTDLSSHAARSGIEAAAHTFVGYAKKRGNIEIGAFNTSAITENAIHAYGTIADSVGDYNAVVTAILQTAGVALTLAAFVGGGVAIFRVIKAPKITDQENAKKLADELAILLEQPGGTALSKAIEAILHKQGKNKQADALEDIEALAEGSTTPKEVVDRAKRRSTSGYGTFGHEEEESGELPEHHKSLLEALQKLEPKDRHRIFGHLRRSESPEGGAPSEHSSLLPGSHHTESTGPGDEPQSSKLGKLSLGKKKQTKGNQDTSDE